MTKRLPLGGLPSTAGLAASTSVSADTITIDGHGLETGDAVKVRAVEGGTLASPLDEDTTYYAIRVSNAEIQLSDTVGGSTIDITAAAVSMIVSREPDFDYWIQFYSRWADTSFPAHMVPFGRTEPVPPLVSGLVADLCAKRMFNVGGSASDTLKDMETASVAQLARFATGMPLRGSPAPAPTNLAIAQAGLIDPRGWTPWGSGRLP